MRSLLKYFFVLSVFLLFSCSKITHKLMKGAAEEAVENSSDKTLRKLSKKALLEENSTYVGKSLEDQVLKKVIRKKITKEMEEEGVKSFFQYGTNKAAKKIAFISYSPAKKRMISETSSNLYLKNINNLKAESPSTVNKDALTQALQKYAGYKEAEYTAESWKAFAQAYAGAREVKDDANATQEAVDAAVEKLNVAAKKLVKAEKPVDPEKPGKPENPDKPNKPETAEKPSKPEKPAKPGKVTTGLQTNTGILMVAGTLAIAGFGVLVALARRKRY